MLYITNTCSTWELISLKYRDQRYSTFFSLIKWSFTSDRPQCFWQIVFESDWRYGYAFLKTLQSKNDITTTFLLLWGTSIDCLVLLLIRNIKIYSIIKMLFPIPLWALAAVCWIISTKIWYFVLCLISHSSACNISVRQHTSFYCMLEKQSGNSVCICTGQGEFPAYATTESYSGINHKFTLYHLGGRFCLSVFSFCPLYYGYIGLVCLL